MKPIKTKSTARFKPEVHYIGGPRPYLVIDTLENGQVFGYIEDKDVHRLAKWCKRCLMARRLKKASN